MASQPSGPLMETKELLISTGSPASTQNNGSFFTNRIETLLRNEVEKNISAFPRFCDRRLQKGLARLAANTSSEFFSERTLVHLKRLLLVQFFLQKKMEASLSAGIREDFHLFLKVFAADSFRICVALVQFAPREEEYFSFSQIIKELDSCIPGLEQIDHSFYTWWDPELSYRFYYFEILKARGKILTSKELSEVENSLHKKLCCMPGRPAIFSPYNAEEAYRQLILLKKEIANAKDLPQASLRFQGQNHSYLEFLIYLVCPEKDALTLENTARLPSNVRVITHFQQTRQDGVPIESIVFSMQIPLGQFLESNAINLVHARRVASRYVEDLVGPFRDYNGGLFEIQQKHFDKVKNALCETIPSFSVFAERLFYSVKPIEQQLSLSLEVFELLFSLFSRAFEYKQEIEVSENNISILKLRQPLAELKYESALAYAYIELSGFHYYCFINKAKDVLKIPKEKAMQVLRLNFLEGPPVSLNPWCIYGEIRCRFLTKALYEGLTRIDLEGNPCLAGAESVQLSGDGVTYVFKIRNHYWSNGERVTAFHYERTWKQALFAQDVPSEPFFILKNAQKIKKQQFSIHSLGIKAVDDATLHVELERPDPYFLEKLAHPLFFPLLVPSQEPKHFNGPYLFLSKNEKEFVIEQNPYYWDRESIFFNQIRIGLGKTAAEIHQDYLDKAVDWVGTPFSCFPLEFINTLRARGELKEKMVARALWVYFNTNHPLFSSPLIRHAFHAAIDRSFIRKVIFPDDVSPPSLFPIGISSHVLHLEKRSDDSIRKSFSEGLDRSGISEKTLSPIYFNYYAESGYTELAHYLKERWEKIFNLPIVLQGMRWNAFRSDLTRGNFHLAQCTESAFSRDPLDLLQRFEHKNSPYNYSGWSDPVFQNKIVSIRNSSLASRQQLLLEAEECLYNELPFIPVINRKFMYATTPSLIDYVIDGIGDVDFRWAKLR